MRDMKDHARETRTSLFAPRVAAVLLAALAYACGGSGTVNKTAETMQKAPNAANEAAAIRTLQTIFRAETQHMATGSGGYGTLDELVREGSLDQRFSGDAPVVEGYVFTLKLVAGPAGQPTSYTVNADPKDAAAPGARHLYMDAASNVVRASSGRPATANDPPLQ